tara:strand:- start:12289 stop:12705 length:417 start_codon:yes stop_codon:yes gene_type:complete
MKKIVKLTESDLNRIVKKVMKESVENPEMSGSWERSKYEPTPREGGVKDVFGKYGEDMLPNIIRYLRKNPDAILRRMSKMYPEIYMRHIPLMGEVENKTVKDYDLNNDSDIDAFNKDIKNSDSSNVTVSKGSGQISDS